MSIVAMAWDFLPRNAARSEDGGRDPRVARAENCQTRSPGRRVLAPEERGSVRAGRGQTGRVLRALRQPQTRPGCRALLP